jgi:4-hydroxy-2-oxoglutarate aldolase
MGKTLSGMIAPITTPFCNDEVSIEQLEENVRRYAKTRLTGLFALGSNGEGASLSDTEKLMVLEVVSRAKSSEQCLIAGVGHESTRQTVLFAKEAVRLGAEYAAVITPFYHKKALTDDALIGYYSDVADQISIPVLVYNAPGFTGMTISPRVVEVLSTHGNILGMKDSSPANMSRYLEVCGGSFAVLSGTMNTLLPALLLGASGGVVSLADAFPSACCEMYDSAKKHELAMAREMHFRLSRLNRAVSGTLGVAGVKYAMNLAGYHGGDPRLPLLPLTAIEKASIQTASTEAGVELSHGARESRS